MEEDKAVHHGRNEQQNSLFLLTPTILSKEDAMIEESKEKLYKETRECEAEFQRH